MTRYLNQKIITSISGAILLFYYSSASALNWTIRPSINLNEIYSDNISQDTTNERSALVTEVSPGISVNGTSSISRFDFNYRLQSLYNAGGDAGLDLNQQLQMNTDYTLVNNKLFIDSSSSISQQNISNRRTVSDNISGGRNTTTVSTFRISPYWTPHFKDYASGEFRVTYDRVSTSGGNSDLSKTNSLSQNINLRSGPAFSYVSWSISYSNSTRSRSNSNSEDVNLQSANAEIRYAIARKFSVFMQARQSSNSFQSSSNNNNNGVSYTFGGQWQPSQRFRLEAGVGNDYFVTVEITPFSRLHWITTYRNNDTGLITSSTWNTELDYNTRRSVWRFSYNEQTTTTQQLLLDQRIFNTEDILGNPQDNIVNNQQQFNNPSLPTLTDEVFINKRGALSVSFNTAKSTLSANIFRTIRTFEQTRNDQTVTGVSASWNWKFTRRSNLTFRSSWQKTESDGVNSFSDQRINASVRATRNILPRLNGNIEYRYTDQSSDDNVNSYSENRISASLSYRF